VRHATFTVKVTTQVPEELEPRWDELHDILRVAFQHIALDNLEWHFPDAIVEVAP
jgi:hypothetical protein